MPEFDVREVTEEDLPGFRHVRSRVYRGGAPVQAEEKILRDDSIGFVVRRGSEVVGTATALRMTCSRDGELHPCAGIASVAVLPEWRGSGAGTALMEGIRPFLVKHGFVVGALHPFRDPWYRRLGYASIGIAFEIECPADRLPDVKGDLPVREVGATEHGVLESVSATLARRYNGFNVRTTDQWWRTLGGDSPLTVYVAGDPVEAYAVVRLQSDFWVKQTIKEVMWTTERGYAAMMTLFRQLGFNKTSLVWTEPADSPTLARHFDRGSMTMTLEGPPMYRLLEIDDPNEAHERTRVWLGDPSRVFNVDRF